MIQFKNGDLLVLPSLLTVLLLSLGFFFIPVPIKLDTYFGEPISLNDNESAEEFTIRVASNLQTLMHTVDTLPERDYPSGKPQLLTLFIVGIISIIANVVIHTIGLSLLWSSIPFIFIFYLYKIFYKQILNSKNDSREKAKIN